MNDKMFGRRTPEYVPVCGGQLTTGTLVEVVDYGRHLVDLNGGSVVGSRALDIFDLMIGTNYAAIRSKAFGREWLCMDWGDA